MGMHTFWFQDLLAHNSTENCTGLVCVERDRETETEREEQGRTEAQKQILEHLARQFNKRNKITQQG